MAIKLEDLSVKLFTDGADKGLNPRNGQTTLD